LGERIGSRRLFPPVTVKQQRRFEDDLVRDA
jgi:hypothetical protein